MICKRILPLLGATLLILMQTPVFSQAKENSKWKMDCVKAVAEAKVSGKGVLVFFFDSSSVSANRMWKSLSDKDMTGELDQSFILVMIDLQKQEAMAKQLGVSQSGVLIVYDSKGTALGMLKEEDINTPGAMRNKLTSFAVGISNKRNPASNSANVVQDKTVQTAAKTDLSSKPAGFPGAVDVEQVQREKHLGQEFAIKGRIVVFETSTAANRPYIMTLTKRREDPVQVVYWPAVADILHKGRSLPKEGDKISVRGKLTDYRGRLQFKIDSAEQMQFLSE